MVGFAAVGMGGLLYFKAPNNESQEDSILVGFQLWGSKHKKYKHHHKHKAFPDRYKVSPGLQLPGYPSLEEQKQYMEDLRDINWDAVEADLEKLMKDSQECKKTERGNKKCLLYFFTSVY